MLATTFIESSLSVAPAPKFFFYKISLKNNPIIWKKNQKGQKQKTEITNSPIFWFAHLGK